ncbi:MAG: hypothetical protein M3M88_06570 [Thermoproteota archaeon]|nr:hypothetical protein [Thermoproteota archaeon]
MLFADLFDVQYIIPIITNAIDLMVVIVIGISALQTIFHAPRYIVGFHQKPKDNNIITRNFIKGLLLALELESANAILRMGMFTLDIANVDSHMSQNINDFTFFVAVLCQNCDQSNSQNIKHW